MALCCRLSTLLYVKSVIRLSWNGVKDLQATKHKTIKGSAKCYSIATLLQIFRCTQDDNNPAHLKAYISADLFCKNLRGKSKICGEQINCIISPLFPLNEH